MLLLVKSLLEEFHRLRRLGLLMRRLSAGCVGRSRPLWPNTVEIPGTSAGRWLCAWPTQIVIPTTLLFAMPSPGARTRDVDDHTEGHSAVLCSITGRSIEEHGRGVTSYKDASS
jgi:hypothetical protein